MINVAESVTELTDYQHKYLIKKNQEQLASLRQVFSASATDHQHKSLIKKEESRRNCFTTPGAKVDLYVLDCNWPESVLKLLDCSGSGIIGSFRQSEELRCLITIIYCPFTGIHQINGVIGSALGCAYRRGLPSVSTTRNAVVLEHLVSFGHFNGLVKAPDAIDPHFQTDNYTSVPLHWRSMFVRANTSRHLDRKRSRPM
ncbi:hypothetical protein R6Q59_035261 [Mikania micrantha]